MLKENKDVSCFPVEFFARPAQQVAPYLIGCQLLRRLSDGTFTTGVVVETEAYAQEDKACHGYRSRTKRNNTLFGAPGRWYVYLTYGIYHCVKRALTSRSSGWA